MNISMILSLADQPKSTQDSEVSLEVHEAPRFTQTLQREMVVYEGSSIKLVCFVVGKPVPVVTWYKVRYRFIKHILWANYFVSISLYAMDKFLHEIIKILKSSSLFIKYQFFEGYLVGKIIQMQRNLYLDDESGIYVGRKSD